MYSKLSDDFFQHPKILEVGNEAAGVYARLISYCGGPHSDGEVPEKIVLFIAEGNMSALDRLTAAGLIRKRKADWLVVNYLHHNISCAEWDRQREQNRERVARHREKHKAGAND